MLQWRRPSRGLNKQQFPVWSFFTHGKLQLIVTPLNMQIESFNLIHWKKNHDLHFMWNSHLDKTSFFGRAKGQTAKNLIKKHQVKVATNVSGHWLGLQSSLRSSHLTLGKHFYHEAIFEQVHSKLDGKHLLLEQVMGIALPASLKGLQSVSASSISLQVEWKWVWCPNLEHLSRLQIPQFLPMGLHQQRVKQCRQL